MDRNFQRALPLVLKDEGGFVNDPKDPGGATYKGVTLTTMRRYVKADATIADLKAITNEQVATVYYRQYWSAVQAPALPSGIDYCVFDFAINSGPATAAKFLQTALGVAVDGRVGPQTIAAAEAADAGRIINQICDDRLAWLKRIRHKKTKALLWDTYGRGWTRRVEGVRRNALAMIGKPADVKEIPVPVPKPTVPQTVETEVKKKTNLWSWITGVFGGGGIGAAGLMGADWQTVAVLVGGIVVILLIVLLLRTQIISAVKGIREAVEESA